MLPQILQEKEIQFSPSSIFSLSSKVLQWRLIILKTNIFTSSRFLAV